MKDVYGVEVAYEGEDPGFYGPYTDLQAARVARRLTEEVELATDKKGGNHHPHGVRGANVMPLARYDQFLTGDDRRKARRDTRESEAALAARLMDHDRGHLE